MEYGYEEVMELLTAEEMRALYSVPEHHRYTDWQEKFESPQDWLNSSFSWQDTEHGMRFWNKTFNRLGGVSADEAKKDPIEEITTERGKNYGHPIKHFSCTTALFMIWREARLKSTANSDLTDTQEAALHHGVYMILDKLARMSENPDHRDNLDDIQGYAKCIGMVLDYGKN